MYYVWLISANYFFIIVKQVNSESSDFVLDSSGKYVQYDNVNDPGYRPAESPVPDSARSSPISVGNASVGKNSMITYACNENCNYDAEIKYCLCWYKNKTFNILDILILFIQFFKCMIDGQISVFFFYFFKICLGLN